MGDVGGHLELMEIISHSSDERFARLYKIRSAFYAGGLGLWLAQHLGGWLPPYVITRIFILIYAVGTPLSLFFLARQLHRPTWTVLMTVPLIYNGLSSIGLLNFVVTIPMMFAGVGCAVRWRRDRRWRWPVILTGLAFIVSWTHVLGCLIALTAWGIATMMTAKPWQTLVFRWLPFAGALPLMVAWPRQSGLFAKNNGAGGPIAFELPSLGDRLREIPDWSFKYFRDDAYEGLVCVLVVLWALLLLRGLARCASFRVHPGRARVGPRVLGALFIAFIAAYSVFPQNMREVSIISQRFLMLGVFIAPLFVAWRPRGPAAWAVPALLLALVTVASVFACGRFSSFNRYVVGDVEKAIATLPEGSGLSYRFDRECPVVFNGPHWHLPKAMHALHNRGFSDDSFARRPYFAVSYRQDIGVAAFRRTFPNKLVFSRGPPRDLLADKRLELRWHGGLWWLFVPRSR